MRIECTHGCRAMLDVEMPVAKFANVYQFSDETLAEVRANTDRAIGHAITEAIVAHADECPAANRDTDDCGSLSPMGYTCCYADPDHDGDHEHRVAEIDAATGETVTHLIARWPKQQAVPSGG